LAQLTGVFLFQEQREIFGMVDTILKRLWKTHPSDCGCHCRCDCRGGFVATVDIPM
jgi:hypothetical protein